MDGMMINIEDYISELIHMLKAKFDNRLCYVGLQGSYLRGEAADSSDIDIMVVIDGLSVADLDSYRTIIESLTDFDKSCGFICSKKDLEHWNPLEICNLLHSTKDYFGILRKLVPAYTEQDIRNFLKFSINNLYHEICHRYIHADQERNIQALPFTYKGAFFILQNLHYLRSGEFAGTKVELLERLDGIDRAVLECLMAYSRGENCDFAESYELLFRWCQETLHSL
jgi:predicted nucleotidyltransferase